MSKYHELEEIPKQHIYFDMGACSGCGASMPYAIQPFPSGSSNGNAAAYVV